MPNKVRRRQRSSGDRGGSSVYPRLSDLSESDDEKTVSFSTEVQTDEDVEEVVRPQRKHTAVFDDSPKRTPSAIRNAIQRLSVRENGRLGSRSAQNCRLFLIALAFAFVIGAAAYLWYAGTSPQEVPAEKSINEELFKDFLAKAKVNVADKYSLTKNQRNVIRHIAEKAFLSTDDHPQVLIVAGAASSEVINDINESFHAVQGAAGQTVIIKVKPSTERAEFHNALQNLLIMQVRGGLVVRSAAVADVDQLSWDAILVLHAFCDTNTTNFPIKKILILLSVTRVEMEDERYCDNAVLSFLQKAWMQRGGNEDNVPPILARVGQNIICV